MKPWIVWGRGLNCSKHKVRGIYKPNLVVLLVCILCEFFPTRYFASNLKTMCCALVGLKIGSKNPWWCFCKGTCPPGFVNWKASGCRQAWILIGAYVYGRPCLGKNKQILSFYFLVKLNGGRHVTGVLRGFDPFMNIVLDEAIENVSNNEKHNIGMVVCDVIYKF